MNSQVRARERVPTGRRGRPSKSMIAAALERPFCAYLHKICLNNRLEGHKYCIDHIMNDKTAPYRQCTFVHANTGRRCTRAAHKVDRRASPLCQFHRLLKINTPSTPSIPLEDGGSDQTNSLLEDLSHHRRESNRNFGISGDGGGDNIAGDNANANSGVAHQTRSQSTNTFWDIKEDGSAVPSAKLCKVLARYNRQRLNEEAVPLEFPTMEEIAARHNNADSDTESVDNNLDMFKHASVFTEEELTRTLRDKMIKLRRLYIEQYGYIQYILKEKRLKYIQAQRIEDELYGDLYSFRNNRDSADYAKLRAMLRYHKTFGPESLLQEQAKRRKLSRPPTVGPHAHPNAVTSSCDAAASAAPCGSSMIKSSPNDTRENVCIFSKTAQGCDKPCIPLSPYCKQHILYDTKQVLFRPCAGGMPPCLTPVVSFTRKNKCWLHTAIS